MGHNRRGKGQARALASYRTCAHCEVRGDGLEHFTASCTCGAEGVYCTAHSHTDWGEYAGMSCAEVRRRLKDEEENAHFAEQEAERQDREEQAECEKRGIER